MFIYFCKREGERVHEWGRGRERERERERGRERKNPKQAPSMLSVPSPMWGSNPGTVR